MKKVLILSLCAVLCAALISCEKEKPGVYNPKKKIQKIYCENDGEKVLDQVWNWSGKLLNRIDYYYHGNVAGSDVYSYDSKNRIVRITNEDETLDSFTRTIESKPSTMVGLTNWRSLTI